MITITTAPYYEKKVLKVMVNNSTNINKTNHADINNQYKPAQIHFKSNFSPLAILASV
jgi:hypothetical protein